MKTKLGLFYWTILLICQANCISKTKPFHGQYDDHILSQNQIPGTYRQKEHSETFVDLVQQSGYIVEEHDITTEDGYILSIHRIICGPKSTITPVKPVVILIHGLFAASDIWVLRGPGKDLAYLLVDEGYDVWFLNTRGNFYGKRHKKLSMKESKFWRFSWHEFGVYDVAAMIDYVISITNVKKVSLIGHSMGTTVELVLLSMRPEYNEKVNVVVSFAPVAIFTHTLPGFVNTIGIRYGKQLQKTFQFLGMYEVLPRSSMNVGLYMSFCEGPRIQGLCQKLIFYILGLTNNEEFNTSLMPVLLHHFPQGTSVETLLHFRQIVLSGKFKQYDFGPEINDFRYKNTTPPDYPLEKITTPVILYYGPNDAYTTENDVFALKSRLPNAITMKIPYDKFSHLDFLFLNDTKILLYDNVISVLKKYSHY